MSVPVHLRGILRTYQKKKKNSGILHTATTCNGVDKYNVESLPLNPNHI
jgi:hypothetical protein